MFDNLSAQTYKRFYELKNLDRDQALELDTICKTIIEVHKVDDKVQRETLMKPIRERCIAIHNARIVIAVEKQKSLKKILEIEKRFQHQVLS